METVSELEEHLIVDRKVVLSEVKKHIKEDFRFQRDAAKHYGISDAAITNILKGKLLPTKKMLEHLGLKYVNYVYTYKKRHFVRLERTY